MAGRARAGRNSEITIIRREEVIGRGHHSGAWKLAYADSVTAMMAFFLLMWLLNATTEDQRKGLADYFSPNNLLSRASPSTGQSFGGHMPFDKGELVSDRGAAQIAAGKRPVVTDPEDTEPSPPHADEAPTPHPPTTTPPGTTEATPAPSVAYGMVGPFASQLKDWVEEDARYFAVIRAVLVTHLHGNAPRVSVESGRKMVPNEPMPSVQEPEEAVQAVQIG